MSCPFPTAFLDDLVSSFVKNIVDDPELFSTVYLQHPLSNHDSLPLNHYLLPLVLFLLITYYIPSIKVEYISLHVLHDQSPLSLPCLLHPLVL